MDEVTLNIVVKGGKEAKAVLKELERQGYKWRGGDIYYKKLTELESIHAVGSLQKWSGKRVTWDTGGWKEGYKNITAKKFLGKNECIVIYRNGSETIAFNKATKEKAVAECSPSDTYDFITGAKLAFERLTGKEEKLGFKPHLEFDGENCGVIGENTPFTDAIGRNLRVGDTVELYDKDNKYNAERAIVCSEERVFVMGIGYACKKDGTIVDGWKIILKRRYENIADEERVGVILYVKQEKDQQN